MYYKGHGQVMIISIANTSQMMQFLHTFTISIKYDDAHGFQLA